MKSKVIVLLMENIKAAKVKATAVIPIAIGKKPVAKEKVTAANQKAAANAKVIIAATVTEKCTRRSASRCTATALAHTVKWEKVADMVKWIKPVADTVK